MHAPRPYGLSVYGGQLTNDDLAFIDGIAKRLTNIKRTGELDSLKMVYDLPDGGSVIVYDMGGVFRAVANKSAIMPTPQDDKHDYMAHSHIPMLYSGVITRSIVRQNQGVQMLITEQTRRRLVSYNTQQLPNKRLDIERFVISYHERVQEFEPNPPPTLKHTQYARQRPTWYSGSMAKVMQIVGGYGRQDLENLPNNDWERATVRLPDKVKQAIDDELKDQLLPAYTGYPPKDGQYQYDYKHSHTNVVGFDDGNNPWLLSVSHKGVYAMPLPMIPATTTIAYREWIEQVGDGEILSILDTFGGLPSGETFPENESDFKAWERAGVIIKICDTADFYHHAGYSVACGWSFNDLATDGYNTCYGYNEKGIAIGYTYNLNLSLTRALNHGRLSSNIKTLSDDKATQLAKYLNQIISQLNVHTTKGASIRYKIRRLSDKELYEKMDMSVDDWENLELPPIAHHGGNVRQVYQGKLYNPNKFEYQPQIKFADPLANACISFDFSQLEDYPKPNPLPKCDTIMFAYFAENDLKVVKYYYDANAKAELEVDTNFEPYMTTGSYYQTVRSGVSELQGNFYHSDIDERVMSAKSTTHTTIEGKDLGYDTKPFFAFDYFFSMQGVVYRNRYFSHLTKTKSYGNHSVSMAFCVPFFIRDGVLFAMMDTKHGVRESEGLSRYHVQDPTIYHMWTWDFIWHWKDGAYPPAQGKPFPKDGNPCWVEASTYSPSPANAFADNGDWLGSPPLDISWLTRPDKKTYALNGGGGPPNIKEYFWQTQPKLERTGYVSLSMYPIPKEVHKDIPDPRYFISSPDEYGTLFYRDACKNVMGETEYSNISESKHGIRYHWGNSQIINSVGHKQAHHFIGVINE